MDKVVVKDYRNNEKLRRSFNELAMATFHLDFEDWYQNGYWTEKYNPYSIVIDGKVVANVSVNTTEFEVNGVRKCYIQLGTVMTDKAYRGQGLIRTIMEEIENEYAGKVDGWYLFANDKVLDFYPKFGFQPAKEYEYFYKTSGERQILFKRVKMDAKEAWDVLEERIRSSYPQAALELVNNSQLPMFYVSKFMQENVYYSKELDTYVIAEIEEDTAVIFAIISTEMQDIKRIAESIGCNVKTVTLGFTPKCTEGLEVQEVVAKDTTLFIKGDLKYVGEEQMMFPLLAHA